MFDAYPCDLLSDHIHDQSYEYLAKAFTKNINIDLFI